MISNKPKRRLSGSSKPSVKSADIARKPSAIGASTNRHIPTQTFHVSGMLYGAFPATISVYAPNYDEAMKQAHDFGMHVKTCLPMKQKQK